jgi:cytochrome c biogenesis protein CcmG/thiol:disulfide interchange protein DsbE
MAASRGLKVLAGTLGIGAVVVAGALWFRPRTPELAADFALSDLAGKAVRLSALRGRVVLVNLWTTWCPPCREEMPSMERLYQRVHDRGVELLAVSEDESGARDQVEAFVRDLKVTFPVLLDPDREVGLLYGVWGYPETFVIDRQGRVVERVIGPRVWDSPEQVASIEALLAAAEGPAQ